ncbi:hypothetical protein D3C86_1950130 [compost metagenome]
MVSAAIRNILYATDGRRVEAVRNIRYNYADGLRPVFKQADRYRIGIIVQLLRQVDHLLLGFFTDFAAVTQSARHSRFGNAELPCNLFDGDRNLFHTGILK